MKKQLLMTSILAFGMGLVQAQTPAPMQGGAQDPKSSGAQAPGSMAPASGAAAGSAPTGTTDQAAAPESFKGCLTGSSGNWNLAADNGQTLKISGTDNQLSTYNNQQVNIHGTQATDGTVKVTSIDKVSDSCNATGQAASSSTESSGPMSNQSTTSNTQSTTTTSANPSTGATSPSTTGAQSTTGAAAASPSTTTPPVSEQTPASTVGGNTSDQGAAQQPPASTTGQNATAAGSQSATQGSVPHTSDMDQNQAGNANAGNQAAGQSAGQKLPQTASPLPLLGLLGFGSLVTGFMGRRKK
jgi:hypothetical protein